MTTIEDFTSQLRKQPSGLFLGEEAATAAPPPRPTTQTQKGFI